ncbi:hypothetical protein [Kutzneria sp. 744]|uniref:hypothetical protein n=1 Tax=Kutzneria sp. (strain 744) TaxID=345341 RepID=UPI001E5CF65B|nr:hypothetical protein [Kutzneria sp. 744]
MVRVRHAEQLADDQRRHRQREVGDQVGGLVAGQHVVDQAVDDLLDARPHGLHPLDHEVAGQHLAVPVVLGVVHRDERPAVLAPGQDGGRLRGEAGLAAVGG